VSHQLQFGCVSGPVMVSFLYVDMCPVTQTQNRHGFYLHHNTRAICNLTRESCIVSLQSNKMCTRAHSTTPILHTLHTRPDITSHMSRAGSLTNYTSSRDVSRTVRIDTQSRTSKSVLCARLTPAESIFSKEPSSQNTCNL
jgi:hypothetical protein